MDKYVLLNKFTAQTGKRDELVAILLAAAKLVSAARGCGQYLIYKHTKDYNAVFISEIWDSKEDHDNSLKIDGCMELISKAMPLLDGKPESNTLEFIGGKSLNS
jgi:quinol monooxygenase YgiN